MSAAQTIESLQARVREMEAQLSELAEVKATLRDLEAKYKVLVENANDAIFVLQDGKIKFANPCALEIAGLLTEELENSHFSEFLHPEEKEMVLSRHQRRLKGEKVLSMYPLRIVNRRGEVVWVEVNAVRIEWEGAPATLNIIRDITSQKMLAGQYYQLESLTTVRTLAGGIAHGFNNLLMGIQGSVSLLSLSIGKNHPLYENLERIESCVDESSRLVKQLVGFAQCGKFKIETIHLEPLLEEAMTTIRRSTRQIQLRKSFVPDLWPVDADRGQLDQVFLNILVNAMQAITTHGEIEVSAENTTIRQAPRNTAGIGPGRYVRVDVRDNGCGMDETIRKRVFEPFFTTKSVANHRGLGMACAFGIVANHGGTVDVTSIRGKGTSFTVLLPAADRQDESLG